MLLTYTPDDYFSATENRKLKIKIKIKFYGDTATILTAALNKLKYLCQRQQL